MKVLLDENFPLQLYRALRDAGYQAEHIITSGRRGMSDAEIIERLASDEDSRCGSVSAVFATTAPVPSLA